MASLLVLPPVDKGGCPKGEGICFLSCHLWGKDVTQVTGRGLIQKAASECLRHRDKAIPE